MIINLTDKTSDIYNITKYPDYEEIKETKGGNNGSTGLVVL